MSTHFIWQKFTNSGYLYTDIYNHKSNISKFFWKNMLSYQYCFNTGYVHLENLVNDCVLFNI